MAETTNCKWQVAGQTLDNDGNKRKCGSPQWQSYELQNLEKGFKEQLHPLLYSAANKGFHSDIQVAENKDFTIAAGELAADKIYLASNGVEPNFIFPLLTALAADEFCEIEIMVLDSTRSDFPVIFFETPTGKTVIGSGRNYLSPNKILLNNSDFGSGQIVIRKHTGNISINITARIVKIYTC